MAPALPTFEQWFDGILDYSLTEPEWLKGLMIIPPGQNVTVRSGDKTFVATCRIDTPVEIEYFRNGGILHTVLRNILNSGR